MPIPNLKTMKYITKFQHNLKNPKKKNQEQNDQTNDMVSN